MKNKTYILRIFPGILLSMVSFFTAFSQANKVSQGVEITGQLLSTTENITICNNQLPYLWNGITCLTAGTYQATLTGSNGLDSIVTLQLSVINVGTSISNVVICNNELPYQWNGNNYSAEGTYSVTLTSSNGCDSVPILSLTVNDVVTSTTNKIICINQLPFNWNGINYNSSGTYTATLTSSAGCDSIATLNLTIKPVSASTTNITICNNQLPYHWNGNTYPTAGTYSITLIAANGCDSVATLNLATNSTVSSTTTQTVCADQLPYTWNGNSYAAAGSYNVNLMGTSGCDSIATLVLTVTTAVTSQTNKTVCTGQLPYTWNGNSYAAAGNYQVTLTSSSGCDSIAKLHLVVVSFLTSTTNHSICNTQLPYNWNGNNYNTSGIYTASFVTAAGCDSIATLNLNVTTPQTNADTVIICPEALPFTWHGHTFSAGGTYSFDPPVNISFCGSVDTLNLVIQVVIPSFTNVAVCSNDLPYTWNGNTYNTAGTYAVTLTSVFGCDSIANLNLAVGAFATSTTNLTICSDQLPFAWNGNNYDSSGTYTATLVSSTGCDSIATINLLVYPVGTSTTDLSICNAQLPFSWNGNTYSSGGTYSATLTSSNGCDSIATLHLAVSSFLTSTTNLSICNNQLPYTWNGTSCPAPGTYTATLTTNAGCDSIATLNLTVSPVQTSITDVNICNTQLPYNWNGNNYNSGGTYNVTLISSGGCDSIATLNLNVGTAVTSTTDLTICTNQLPFTWNGNSYPGAGSFPVLLTSSNGCDSIAVLNLVVTDILTSTTNVSLCSSQLPYQWNGNNYSTPGTYSVTMHNANGCDSVPILSLTIAPYVTSTTDLIICNNELPYTWNGNTYNGAGTYSVLLAGTGACDSLATLNLTVSPQITSTTNTAICNNGFPYSWNGNSYATAGSYQVTLTSTGGCDSLATLNLSEIPITTSTTNLSICTNQLPYTWNGNSYPSAGTYTVTLTSSAGCDSIATLILFANATVASTTDVVICSNQLPYSWNGNTYSANGTYTVTLTSSSGCDSIATLNLTANATVASTTNISICDNQLPYTWNGNNYSTSGIYTVTLTSSSGCDSIATLNLVANSVVSSTTNINTCVDELPYTWNGNSYSTGGTYTVTLTSSSGCDSIATLILLANATTTSNTAVSICNNQLPYNWNGNNYPVAGIYNITLTSSSGCDSIATLDLSVITPATSTTNIITCNNQLPYSWNGNNYSATGTYQVIITTGMGCDSIAILNLQVNTTSSSTTNTTICSTQLPYSWNGQPYTGAGNYNVVLVNAAGCDSIANLILDVNPTITSNTYASTCSNQLPFSWNGQNYSTAGIHNITLTSSSGCDSVATLNLIINPVVSGSMNATTCSNHLPYSWNGQQYNATGNYSVTLTSAAGCDSIATLHLVVNPVVSSTTNFSICSADLPYIWNGQNLNTSGTYTATLTSSAGCDSIATLNLTVNITPALPAVTSPIVYCQYETTAALTATITTPGSHLLWYNSVTGLTGSTDAPIPSSAIPGTTNYYVSQSNGFCEGPRATITVTVNSKPALGPDNDLRICFGRSADLSSIFNVTGLQAGWTLNQLPVTDLSNITVGGTYQLIAINNYGCADTAIVNLGIQPQVVADAGDDADAEYNIPYQLSGSGNGHYQWSPTTLVSDPFIANPLTTLTNDASFVLMVIDDIGCFALDTIKLRVLKGPTFYVPSAFTPNNDGLNDIFRPTPIGIKDLEYFRVFNRYGELVYETSEISKGWDGKYKGNKQPIGNYVWSLKGTDRTGKVKYMKGNVVLIR